MFATSKAWFWLLKTEQRKIAAALHLLACGTIWKGLISNNEETQTAPGCQLMSTKWQERKKDLYTCKFSETRPYGYCSAESFLVVHYLHFSNVTKRILEAILPGAGGHLHIRRWQWPKSNFLYHDCDFFFLPAQSGISF